MSYVIAAYGVTLAALFAYGLGVASAARAARAEISRTRPNRG
jgi:hypothetical protein